jgi:predicted ABC-type transport system involved in lysophospholipase L1 biosynthesis ATPase subunit
VADEVDLLLSLEGVCKEFRRGELRLVVLKDVWLTVGEGEVVSVVGTRGQGKSTLLRVAAGLERPDGGRVCMEGRDLSALSDRELSRLLRKEVGLAGRGGPGMRLRMVEYVALPLLLGAARRERRALHSQALWALERVGMTDRAGARWEDLSDWDRALAEIAQAIVARPKLMILDDVTDGLSMRETERVAALVHDLACEQRAGVLMGLSDGEATLRSQRVHSLYEGRLSTISDLTRTASNVVRPRGDRWRRGWERAARDG